MPTMQLGILLLKSQQARLKWEASMNTIECEVCSKRLKIGNGGSRNYETQHKNSPTCLAEKKRRDKTVAPAKKPTATLLSWLPKLPKVTNPSIASASAPRLAQTAQQHTATEVRNLQATPSTPKRQPPRSAIARKLLALADGLSNDVPKANANDGFALYANEPSTYDDSSVLAEDLWQEVVNPMLKRVLDYGTDFDPNIIRRGRLGVEGLAWVVDYFIAERGVAECMFEGKLGILMSEMEKLYVVVGLCYENQIVTTPAHHQTASTYRFGKPYTQRRTHSSSGSSSARQRPCRPCWFTSHTRRHRGRRWRWRHRGHCR